MTDWNQIRKMEALIRPGLRVKTRDALGSTAGYFISETTLQRRRSGVTGQVYGYVAGHGGDVWWVVHDGTPQIERDGVLTWDANGVAPYGLDEIDVEHQPPFEEEPSP
jgi:hypothetical protein